MEVHKILGHGFLEAVYQEAMAEELSLRCIPTEREVQLPIVYKEIVLRTSYRADFLCYGDVVVEIKATSTLTPGDEAQLLNYLKASRHRRGLLLDFGSTSLQYKRRVFGYTDIEEDPCENPEL